MKNQVFIALLAILVFFTACGEEGEDKEVKYYKDRVKAESKVKWCAKKMDYPFEEIEKSIEANTIASRSKIYDIIDKAYSEKKTG